MKLFIDCNERYPDLSVSETTNYYDMYIELTPEEYADFLATKEAYECWQERLKEEQKRIPGTPTPRLPPI